MSGRYTPDQGPRAWWLLDLTWAGRTWRLADTGTGGPGEPEVIDADGASLVYVAGLDTVDIEESVDDPATGTASTVSVSLDVQFPEDVAALISAGHDLSSATGVLSRWVEGTAYEDRRVVVDGVILDPEYGEAHETVGLTLESAPWIDESEIPSADEAVIGANWADAAILSLDAQLFGLAYPRIYGRPGLVDTSIDASGWVTGSEAVWVDRRRDSYSHDAGAGSVVTGDRANATLLIAGHHVTVESVYVNHAGYTDGYRFKVTNTYDATGHPVALVLWYYALLGTPADPLYWDIAENLLYQWDDGGTPDVYGLGSDDVDPSYCNFADSTDNIRMWVGWRDEDGTSRGGRVGIGGTVIRNAADVLADLLNESGAGVNRGRFESAAPLLSSFNLDFQINARVKPWEFIQTSILPLLPVSLITGANGIEPVVWRYGAPASEAIARLDTGIDPTLERITKITEDRSAIVNDITVNYAKSARTGNYCATVRLRGDYVAGADASTGYLDPFCAASQRRYRRRDGSALVVEESIDASVVYDTTTATAIGQWKAAAFGLARRTVDYEGSERTYGFLERGSIVLLTDAPMHLVDAVCIVTALRVVAGGRIRLRLLMQTDPARDLLRVP